MRESGQGYWMEDKIAGTIDANMGCSGHANRPAVIATPQRPAGVVGFHSTESHSSGTNEDISPTMRIGSNGGRQPPAVAIGCFQQSSMKGKGTIGYDESGIAKPVKTQCDGQMVLAFDHKMGAKARSIAINEDQAPTLGAQGDRYAVATAACYDYMGSHGGAVEGISPTLKKKDGVATHIGLQVRRLTPVECERLQGFPDDFTRIPWRKKPAEDCPDGPRYKALGNSWAVPCAYHIGRRIAEVLA